MQRAAFLLLGACALTAPLCAQPAQPVPATSTPVESVLAAAPQIVLGNGRIHAVIAPPGPDAFYRGTRFDQAGVLTSLTLNGRDFYGPWFERTAPEVLDYTYLADGTVVAGPDSATSGPVEEFAPLGFAATLGAIFVKIGVGVLRQPDAKPYDHYRHYQIVDGGTRTTRATANSVTFSQTLTSGGYSYVYEKTLTLVPGANQMVIDHVLKNTGALPISTTVYDHNFLKLVRGNGGIRVTLPFAPAAATPPPADLIRLDGDTLTYLRPMTARERLSFVLTGYGATPRDYDIRIADGSGAEVSILGDQPLVRLNIFSIDRVQAVEPYLAIEIPPGGEKQWRYTYSYTAPK